MFYTTKTSSHTSAVFYWSSHTSASSFITAILWLLFLKTTTHRLFYINQTATLRLKIFPKWAPTHNSHIGFFDKQPHIGCFLPTIPAATYRLLALTNPTSKKIYQYSQINKFLGATLRLVFLKTTTHRLFYGTKTSSHTSAGVFITAKLRPIFVKTTTHRFCYTNQTATLRLKSFPKWATPHSSHIGFFYKQPQIGCFLPTIPAATHRLLALTNLTSKKIYHFSQITKDLGATLRLVFLKTTTHRLFYTTKTSSHTSAAFHWSSHTSAYSFTTATLRLLFHKTTTHRLFYTNQTATLRLISFPKWAAPHNSYISFFTSSHTSAAFYVNSHTSAGSLLTATFRLLSLNNHTSVVRLFSQREKTETQLQ